MLVISILQDEDEVACFCLKPDGRHILIAYKSLLLNYYDFNTGERLRSWKVIDSFIPH